MRPSADGPRRSLLALLVALMAAAGCSELTEPSTGYRDPLLYEHNGQFSGGRTFRWIPPVPVFVVTADPSINAVMREQLDAWEATLAGAGGSPLFAPQPVPRHAPSRGIFFTISDLEGAALGQGDPFVEDAIRAGGHPTPLAQRLRLLEVPRPARRAGIPQVLPSGEIQTCEITIDPIVTAEDDFVIRAVVRHELGHCLGFLGHVGRGLMKASCCSLDMTRDVLRVMQRLYRLPPNTAVSP